MRTLTIFAAAAIAEIAGCFAFWAVLRLKASPLWLAAGALSLIAFAWLLTRVEVDYAGRAFAVYGGIYIAASLAWLWLIEGRAPDPWDLAGAGICIAGALVILYAPRTA
jgi:small multidrug resistance family-3 protein